MDFSYENQGANTYLVYEIKEGDSIDTLSLGMLTNNSIPGLTRALFTQMDEKRYIMPPSLRATASARRI